MPVSFGPSDVKNPRSYFWGPVPESYWLTKVFIFDFDWVVREAELARHAMPDQLEADTSLEGLKETFRMLRGFEVRLAMTSNFTQKQVVEKLHALNLAEDFDCIRCAEELPSLKPNPDLNFNVMETLGIKAIKAIAFEVSPEGVEAARKADVFCVVPPSMEGKADYSLNSITGEHIIGLLEKMDLAKRKKLSLI